MRKVFFVFLLLAIFFALFAGDALAATCPAGYQQYQWGTYPCGEKPANICCGASGCSDCEAWCYKYDPICCVIKERGQAYASIAWEYNHCSAADRCCSSPSQAICAGICDSGGCTTGGWYKTCCQVAGGASAGNRLTGATGTCSGGTCFSGTCVRATGCDSNKCLDYSVADCWYLKDCATPVPTCSPVTCYKCDPWCVSYTASGSDLNADCTCKTNCDACPQVTNTPTPTPTNTPTPIPTSTPTPTPTPTSCPTPNPVQKTEPANNKAVCKSDPKTITFKLNDDGDTGCYPPHARLRQGLVGAAGARSTPSSLGAVAQAAGTC